MCSVIEWHVTQNQHVKDESLLVSIKPDQLQELEQDDNGIVLEVRELWFCRAHN